MPALPWSARASLPPTYACFVTASRQAVRRYRDVPVFLRHLWVVRRRLRGAEGLLGYALAVRLRDRTFWTVSAWFDKDAAVAGVPAGLGSVVAASTLASWFCLAEELPIGWDEVQHRLGRAADVRHGVPASGSAASG
jgi:hypothetical protein